MKVIFLHNNDIVLKGKRRQKTCHWVPIGAMGPADIWTTLYPPPPSRPSSGTRVRFFEQASYCIHIEFKHTLLLNLQCFIYYIPSINYLHGHWFFDLWYFQIFTSDFILWQEYECGIWYFCRQNESYWKRSGIDKKKMINTGTKITWVV